MRIFDVNDNSSQILYEFFPSPAFNRFIPSHTHTHTLQHIFESDVFVGVCVQWNRLSLWNEVIVLQENKNQTVYGMACITMDQWSQHFLLHECFTRMLHATDALQCQTNRIWKEVGAESANSGRAKCSRRSSSSIRWMGSVCVCGELWAHNGFIGRIMVKT